MHALTGGRPSAPLALLLLARGVAEADAEVVARQEASTTVLGSPGRSPLGVLGAHLDVRELAALAGVVADALAMGPHGLFAAPWRRLYTTGCPLDHLWRTLWHAFKEPKSDYQDEAWLAPAEGMANVERYVALGFPRLQLPSTFGPGLGCASLLENALAASAELVRRGAPSIAVADGLAAGRAALTARARLEVDAAAGVDDAERIARPSAEALSVLRSKLVRGDDLTDAEQAAVAFFDLPDDRDDHLVVADAPAVATRWFEATRERLASGRLVVDAAVDRYRLIDEPAARKAVVATRRAPPGPLARPRALEALLASWSPRDPTGDLPTAAHLELEDPILWLRAIAEAPAFSSAAAADFTDDR